MKRNRVNVLTVVNSASNITTEIIDGKPHIVVRGITPVVDDIVMNRKLYPAAEIEKAYNTLERNPMPLGHPKVDGKHVSARDARAVNEYHVGAWLQNVSHKDGKVTGDMYVNRQYAESSEKGKRLINRLDEMLAGTNSDPIHISTGLLYSGIAANGESKGKKYNEIATNMMFDHVAVLLDEPGAGTPEEGVGIFVNSERIIQMKFGVARDDGTLTYRHQRVYRAPRRGRNMDRQDGGERVANAFGQQSFQKRPFQRLRRLYRQVWIAIITGQ